MKTKNLKLEISGLRKYVAISYGIFQAIIPSLFCLLNNIFGKSKILPIKEFLNPIIGDIIPLIFFIFYIPIYIYIIKQIFKKEFFLESIRHSISIFIGRIIIFVGSFLIMANLFYGFIYKCHEYLENPAIRGIFDIKAFDAGFWPHHYDYSLFYYDIIRCFKGILLGFNDTIIFYVCIFKSMKKFGIWSHILTALIYSSVHIFDLRYFYMLFTSIMYSIFYKTSKNPGSIILSNIFTFLIILFLCYDDISRR